MSQQEILNLQQALASRIVGQQDLIERLLIAILADGHLLVEGAPGLAKTRAIKALGDETYPLPEVFLVMAAQNPLEQEGTYPLPEAQLDRFLMHVRVDYPDGEDEKAILAMTREEARSVYKASEGSAAVVGQQSLLDARDSVLDIHLDDSLENYIVELTLATRSGQRYGDDLKSWIQHGASPRASMAMDRCARAFAWLKNRDFVTPEDIQAVAPDVLRHRIILSFEAEAEGMTSDACIEQILGRVAVP